MILTVFFDYDFNMIYVMSVISYFMHFTCN